MIRQPHRPISCSEAVRWLWDYLDQSVAPQDRVKVEEHLASCRTCCGELEFVGEVRKILASSAALEIPAEIQTRLERFVQAL